MNLTCNIFRKIIFGLIGIVIVLYIIGFYFGSEFRFFLIPIFIVLISIMVGCFIGHCVITED